MMDCKKALSETGGDIIKAIEFLRTKGLASAEKKASRTTAEGRIGSYIHDSRIGILIEVNCETDFVSRGEIFKELVDDLAMQQLREETGAGMMDCKKALAETGGDLEKAQDYLRKKGLSSADKKSSRLAAEGRIGSYIHDSRIGVLIEVNCETDFVGRDLAMQVVACPQVQFVSTEDVPKSIVEKEKELEMQREDLQSKPENIREKIVDGRISKRLGELALLEQPFIKDDKLLVKDLVKQTVASLGENIKVRRFVRFTLGEDTD
ncbi:unnamed protein product [Linum tenue]|uniref:Elongation factor Ts, mitochondrial n=1 Tax=Linum tenue TaxID=586396 RepID=A0AAV0S6H0_9ROSI|nr:unnamed protein product [Linum tenue]